MEKLKSNHIQYAKVLALGLPVELLSSRQSTKSHKTRNIDLAAFILEYAILKAR